MVEARVTFKREDGRINVSMRPIKEKALISDGQIIMEYLNNQWKQANTCGIYIVAFSV